MSIIRRKKEQYTVICNDILNNEKLTIEALGMLVFMLSKPNDWEFSQEWLGNRFGKGRDAMRSIMRNLTECGYVRREITRNEKGQVRTITIVSESPDLLSYQENSQPPVAKPAVVYPTLGEPTPLLNTDINKILNNQIYTHSEKTKKTTIKKWLETIKEKGEKPIGNYGPVLDYVSKIGLPEHFWQLCWLEFKRKHLEDDSKKYIDWRRAFSNCLQNNWYKLWWLGDNGYQLTTAGQQAEKYHFESNK